MPDFTCKPFISTPFCRWKEPNQPQERSIGENLSEGSWRQIWRTKRRRDWRMVWLLLLSNTRHLGVCLAHGLILTWCWKLDLIHFRTVALQTETSEPAHNLFSSLIGRVAPLRLDLSDISQWPPALWTPSARCSKHTHSHKQTHSQCRTDTIWYCCYTGDKCI